MFKSRDSFRRSQTFIEPGRFKISLGDRTNAELAEHFLEWLVCMRYSRPARESYQRVVRALKEFCGRKHFRTVTPVDIRDFIISMSRRDLSADIAHRYIWALRCFFDFLCMQGVVREVAPRHLFVRPAKKLKPKSLSEANVKKLIGATTNPRDRAMLELFYATGCRPTELLGIRFQDIDFKRRAIQVSGKGSSRTVFYGKPAADALKAYVGQRTTGYVFLSRRHPVQKGCVVKYPDLWAGFWLDYTSGQRRQKSISLGPPTLSRKQAWSRFRNLVPNPDFGHRRPESRRITRSAVCDVFRQAAHKAGLGRVTAYALRHSFATHLIDHGASVRCVQELLGHTCLSTTQTYAFVSARDIERAYRNAHPRNKTARHSQ